MIPTTLTSPPPIMQAPNTDQPFVQRNLFSDMMQAKTNLIAEAMKLLGPNGNENAQSILKEFSYRELLDVVEDLTAKSAN